MLSRYAVNSVATANIIDDAITTVKIVDDAITSAKIKLVPLSLLSQITHNALFPNLLQKYNVTYALG